MDETRISRRNKRSNQQPDWLLRILGGTFLIIGIITAILVYKFIRQEVREMTLFELPGKPILDDPINPDGENGDSQDASVNPQPPVVTAPELDLATWDGASRVNILVMGLDFADWRAGEGPPRTDTMILFTYDPGTETAAMLSIPRDLWVNVPGFGQNKINTAYFLGEGNRVIGGGTGLAVRTAEEFLGIDIHYYAIIDFYVFVNFIDYIGGVCVEVTEQIEIDVIDKKRKATLYPGENCMKGAHLLGFIRARYNVTDADIGRAQNQQRAIIAIKDKLMHPDIQALLLTNPIEIWNIFSDGIVTNIGFDEALGLGLDALKINPELIGRYVISVPDYGSFERTPDGSQTIIKPLSQKIRELRDEIFGEAVGPGASGDATALMKEEAAKIGVYNGSGISGLAGATQEYLLGLGVNVVEVGNADYVSSTTIYDYTGNPYTVKYLVDLLGIIPTRIFNSYDPNSTIDVSVVVGGDWSVP